MAITITMSNHAKFQLASKLIDFDSDTFKIILMNTTFAFNADSHATLADVTADQLATGNGYTQNDKTLTTPSLSEDDTDNRAECTFDDPSWTGTGGAIGPTGAAIVYDDTTADDTVMGCIDFGTDYTIADGNVLEINDIVLTVS